MAKKSNTKDTGFLNTPTFFLSVLLVVVAFVGLSVTHASVGEWIGVMFIVAFGVASLFAGEYLYPRTENQDNE